MVLVVAGRALPLVVVVDNNLSVEAAYLAVVALGVELGVLDVVVDEADNLLQSLQVVAHVGNLHIGDAAAGGNLLELGLEGELLKGVNVLPHVHVIAVGIIALVGYIGDRAEALLVDAGKAVAQALSGGAVESEADVGLGLPVIAGLAQPVHHLQGKLGAAGLGVADAGHQLGHLIESDVAQGDGGVAAVEQGLDGGALGQAGDGAVLPVDGRGVGLHVLQGVVTAHNGLKAQLQALLQQGPELLLVAPGQNADLGQVQRDHALVEAALKLVIAVLVLPGSQEGAAAHGREHVALIIFPHLLGGDVVGVHALGGALDGQLGNVVVFAALQAVVLVQHVHQLGEGGGDIHALLVLDALQALAQHLLHDHGVLLQVGVVLPEVEEQGDEGRLAVGGHEGVDLVLDGLHAALQLVLQPVVHQPVQGGLVHLAGALIGDVLLEFLLAAAEILSKMAHVHALAAVLVGGHAGDDLGGDGAGHLEALGRLNELAVHHGSVVQHVPDVDEAAVEDGLNKVVGVVEVDGALVVGLGDVLGQQNAPGQVPAHLAGNVVPLGSGDHGVLVGVLLGQLLVLVAQQGEDGLVGGIGLAHQGPVVAVNNIGLGQVELILGHQSLLHQVLDVLHQHPLPLHALNAVNNGVNPIPAQLFLGGNLGVGLLDGGYNLASVVIYNGPVSLDHFHAHGALLFLQ